MLRNSLTWPWLHFDGKALHKKLVMEARKRLMGKEIGMHDS
jgi:hypothetical protein